MKHLLRKLSSALLVLSLFFSMASPSIATVAHAQTVPNSPELNVLLSPYCTDLREELARQLELTAEALAYLVMLSAKIKILENQIWFVKDAIRKENIALAEPGRDFEDVRRLKALIKENEDRLEELQKDLLYKETNFGLISTLLREKYIRIKEMSALYTEKCSVAVPDETPMP